ncbi:MAG TPA: imidazole glycerol phosphate synthase subunit HisH [Candidatus Omnitrophota bacterium]|nr:imidazole glycerol phosphate synthase subunit HisH [Candidatus Omnitrophota bacterium]
MKKVTVIDYGLGNVFSVCKAFEHLGCKVTLTDNADLLIHSDRIVLPGVGAFKSAMAELQKRNLVEPILTFSKKNKPLLGICLGMQLLLEFSQEFGTHKGLGLIAGKVEPIPRQIFQGNHRKIPHIGWNDLIVPEGGSWEGTILEGIPEKTSVYFVHSFNVVPKNPLYRLADATYEGYLISAAIRKDLLYGCQFHPEKSSVVGLKILENFLRV